MIAFIILLLVDLYILMNTGRGAAPVAAVSEKEGKWTVYGTMGCGWTRKQLDYMKTVSYTHLTLPTIYSV